MTTPEKVMETLKERKVRAGLTNQQLAEATGIPLSNIKKFFAGDIKNPSLFYTAAACEFFGISLDDLMCMGGQKDESDLSKLEKAIAKERKSRIVTTIVFAVLFVTYFALRM